MAYYVFVAIRAVHSFHLDWNVEYSNYIVLNGSYPLPNGIDPSIKESLPEGHIGRLCVLSKRTTQDLPS